MNHSTLPLFALKVCTTCGEAKSLSEYHKQGNGLRAACKACTNAQNRSIYEKNHDAHLEAKRRYRQENPEARAASRRAYDNRNFLKRQAHAAVKNEIRTGRMLPASKCNCCKCGEVAEIYHHRSYERRFWLDVKPMCRVCHGKEHHAHDQ